MHRPCCHLYIDPKTKYEATMKRLLVNSVTILSLLFCFGESAAYFRDSIVNKDKNQVTRRSNKRTSKKMMKAIFSNHLSRNKNKFSKATATSVTAIREVSSHLYNKQ